MPSSRPTRSASRRDHSAASSSVMPAMGISGQTSVAPIRGCSPWCRRMSISSAALRMAWNAASTTGSGSPAKVTTVRLVAWPGSTWRRVAPPTASMAGGDLADHLRVSAFGKVGHALDQAHRLPCGRCEANWAWGKRLASDASGDKRVPRHWRAERVVVGAPPRGPKPNNPLPLESRLTIVGAPLKGCRERRWSGWGGGAGTGPPKCLTPLTMVEVCVYSSRLARIAPFKLFEN